MKNINLEKKKKEVKDEIDRINAIISYNKLLILDKKKEIIKLKKENANYSTKLISNLRAEIKNLKFQIKVQESNLPLLYKKYNYLESLSYFNRNYIFDIILYLVNNIESSKYVLRTIPVLISVGTSFKYNLVYLSRDDMESASLYELKTRFPRMVDKSEITRANVSDNYLELLIYKDSDNENIIFDDSDTKVQDYMKDIPIIPHSKIYDTRFSYIYDFLNLVIDKRIESNSLLSIEELYKLADEFINHNNNAKKY